MVFILARFPEGGKEPMLEYLKRHRRVTGVIRVLCWFSRPHELQFDVAIITDYKRNQATVPLAQSLLDFGVQELAVIEAETPNPY